MKEKIKTTLWWMVTIIIICIVAFCVRTCEKKKKLAKQTEKEMWQRQKLAAIINDPYIYQDRNGVYHIDPKCYILSTGRYSAGDDEYAVYSASYQKKNKIENWDEFASCHQLCNECFNSEILQILASPMRHNPDSINIYNSDNEPLERIILSYDLYGNITRKEIWKYENGEWHNYMLDVYEYDENGQEIMSAGYWWQDEMWVGDIWRGKIEKRYDASGNPDRLLCYKWENNDWILDTRLINVYDDRGNLIEEQRFKYISKKWQLKERKKYENFYRVSSLERSKDK